MHSQLQFSNPSNVIDGSKNLPPHVQFWVEKEKKYQESLSAQVQSTNQTYMKRQYEWEMTKNKCITHGLPQFIEFILLVKTAKFPFGEGYRGRFNAHTEPSKLQIVYPDKRRR